MSEAYSNSKICVMSYSIKSVAVLIFNLFLNGIWKVYLLISFSWEVWVCDCAAAEREAEPIPFFSLCPTFVT